MALTPNNEVFDDSNMEIFEFVKKKRQKIVKDIFKARGESVEPDLDVVALQAMRDLVGTELNIAKVRISKKAADESEIHNAQFAELLKHISHDRDVNTNSNVKNTADHSIPDDIELDLIEGEDLQLSEVDGSIPHPPSKG